MRVWSFGNRRIHRRRAHLKDIKIIRKWALGRILLFLSGKEEWLFSNSLAGKKERKQISDCQAVEEENNHQSPLVFPIPRNELQKRKDKCELIMGQPSLLLNNYFLGREGWSLI